MACKEFKVCLSLLAAFVLGACSNSASDSSGNFEPIAEKDSIYADFVHIAAENAIVQLGSDLPDAKFNERPAMRAKFTYDFSIGSHEVTCEEFNKISQDEFNGKMFTADCPSDSLPISNVTYFDAILFANAYSKSAGKDTAYTFNAATFDGEGHCTHLDGLAFSPDIEAFRLPTEAEWILAAHQDWSTSKSWNADNSEYKAHNVCSAGNNSIGLCDMAGNVMEWVNDWLGTFKDTTITNYVGAPDGGSIGERIVKGGSFRSAPKAINTFSRGDIYTVTSSTRADYVGFRLALGAIPNATWLSNNGKASNSNIVTLASSSIIKKQTGTFRARLAFRNDLTENIAYINYAEGMLNVIEIEDSISAYHPEISPDGERVAFCTRPEGVSGNSSLYVRDLNADGSNLVKLEVESAAIPRWRILENGDTAIVYVSSAANNKNNAEFKSYSTWQVAFKAGAFGTPQKLFDGNYHGGISDDGRIAVTGARLLRARISDNGLSQTDDSIWYNGEQACNASLAKDGSKRTLFLDFGSATGTKFVGTPYGTHEQLLVADSTGKLIQSMASPAGYAFDHTEWAAKDLAVATLTNANGAHERIVLVNMASREIVDLVKGDEIWHPSLWIGTEEKIVTNLDLDSAGQYYISGGSEAAICLRNKMEILWSHRDSKLAILGSSRPLNGVIPKSLDSALDAINLSNVPNSIYVSDYIFSNYLLKQLKQLKYVVISLDIDMWWKRETDSYDNFFYKEYRQYPGFVYDENHRFWEKGYPEGLAEASHEALNFDIFEQAYIESRGFNAEETGSWETAPTVDFDSTWMLSRFEDYNANLHRFEAMVAAAANQGVTIIGVIFPMSPAFKNTGSFGRYGIRRSEAPAIIQEIADLSKRYPNFILMDENKMGDHDYSDDMAANRDHLSLKGAVHFTERLDSLIKALQD